MSDTDHPGPRAAYTARLVERKEAIRRAEAGHRRLGNYRLAAVVAGAVILWAALFQRSLSIAWAAIPLGVFVTLMVLHERLLRRLETRKRAAAYYEAGLARLDGKWRGSGDGGERYLAASHLYAQDLDLFGPGSLFQLLCTARTHIGEDTLARWLLSPAAPEVVRARQEAVEELRWAIDLREDLAVLAEGARSGVDPVALAAWGEAPALLQSRAMRWGAAAFSLAGLCALAGGFASFLGALQLAGVPPDVSALCRDAFFAAYVAGSVILYRARVPLAQVVDSVEGAAHELRVLSEVLVRLERESFRSPLLRELRASLDTAGAPPSTRLAKLDRLIEWLDSRDNVFVKIAQPLVLYSLHLAFAVEDWRAKSGPAVRRWLEATGEMEALCSLAAYAYEHPGDPFPEFLTGEPRIEATGVGHPLLPESRVVRNDVALGGDVRVLVVSGSNMSGKSTLLRTLGTNIVLAQAGAPVRAQRLRLTPLLPGASIRVSDSLQDGMSRFYAEIVRLRDILQAAAGPMPVFFLLDEFLHGTNSHDRRIGAVAMVKGLVARGAIGLITTHDLALADIADDPAGKARNVHFEDHLEGGEMKFDYVMHPGVVTKSNAIELMRSVGLEL